VPLACPSNFLIETFRLQKLPTIYHNHHLYHLDTEIDCAASLYLYRQPKLSLAFTSTHPARPLPRLTLSPTFRNLSLPRNYTYCRYLPPHNTDNSPQRVDTANQAQTTQYGQKIYMYHIWCVHFYFSYSLLTENFLPQKCPKCSKYPNSPHSFVRVQSSPS
jgi:hypothetical protein